MATGIHRVLPHPVEMTITERRRLAQEVRNDLATYRRIASAAQDDHRDKILNRIVGNVHRILGYEGCQETHS